MHRGKRLSTGNAQPNHAILVSLPPMAIKDSGYASQSLFHYPKGAIARRKDSGIGLPSARSSSRICDRSPFKRTGLVRPTVAAPAMLGQPGGSIAKNSGP